MNRLQNEKHSRRSFQDWRILTLGLITGFFLGCSVFFFLINDLISERQSTVVSNDLTLEQVVDDTLSTTSKSFSIDTFVQGKNPSTSVQDFRRRIEALSVEQLTHLVNEYAGNSSINQNFSIATIMVGKLASLEPTRALKSVWMFPSSHWANLLEVVFAEWAVKNVSDSLKAAKDLTGSLKETSLLAIIAELGEENLSLIQEAAESLEMNSMIERMIQTSHANLLMDRPKEAWSLIVQDNVWDVKQKEILSQIANAWKRENGFDIVQQLYDDFFTNNNELFGELLNSVISNDPSGAFEYLLNMPMEIQLDLSPKVLAVWATTDPEAALDASVGILKASSRNIAVANIVYSWAQTDPLSMLEKVESIPRALQQEAVRLSVRELARTDPLMVVEQLLRLQPLLGQIQLQTQIALVEEWAKVDPIAAKRWIDENAKEPDSRRDRLIQRVLERYALIDAEEAMKLALAEKSNDTSDFGPETYVIESLVEQGLVKSAKLMLNQVREPFKLWSTLSVANSLLAASQSEAALDLVQYVPEQDQSTFFVRLSEIWFTINPKELLKELATFPSGEVRARVAESLLLRAEYSIYKMTSDELSQLNSYQSKEGGN